MSERYGTMTEARARLLEIAEAQNARLRQKLRDDSVEGLSKLGVDMSEFGEPSSDGDASPAPKPTP